MARKTKNPKGSLIEEKRNQEAKLLESQQQEANLKAQQEEANLKAQQEEASLKALLEKSILKAQQEEANLEEANREAQKLEVPQEVMVESQIAPINFREVWYYRAEIGRFDLVNPNSNEPVGLRTKRKDSNWNSK